jgi:hypothetical protein
LSRLARMFAVGAIVLAAAAGLPFGVLLASDARAEDPPPTTVPTPTAPSPTLPTPDPAPLPKPKPKPTPKPASNPAPPRRQVSPTPSYRPPVAPAPATRPAATLRPKVRVHKPKPRAKPKKTTVKKTTTVLPRVKVTPAAGALGVSHTFQARSGGSFQLASLLIVMSLGLAIACFTTAVIPATQVRWRRAAIFVFDRQVNIVLLGCALLTAGSIMVFWSKG